MAPTSSCTDQAVVLETAEPDVQPEAVVQVWENLRDGTIRWACEKIPFGDMALLNPGN